LVDSFECVKMYGPTNPKEQPQFCLQWQAMVIMVLHLWDLWL